MKNESMAKELVELLRKNRITLSLAESCTGGMVAKGIVDIPGASEVFLGSAVTYSNGAKSTILDVDRNVITEEGAVSVEAAREMAAGSRRIYSSDLALSVTGIAGPGGGSAEKPVGLVYIGYCDNSGSGADKYNFQGSREEVREAATEKLYEKALSIVKEFEANKKKYSESGELKFHRIGILTSGGDAPGMNAAIRSVARAAINRGVEVMGIYRGYRGLIDGDIKPFTLRDVSNIINHGGTILYSDRCAEFKTEAGIQKAVDTCKRFRIDGIVAIGGDGTFRGATDLTMHGIPCIGIPGTIDNDIASTDYTIGFDTASNTVIEMIDRLRDTCESHARCNVVEVMGRDSGCIALHTGIATGATAIALPEIPFNEEKVFETMRKAKATGKRHFIVVVAEGLENYAETLAKKIPEKTGIETKFARLAHVVRGGTPSLRDRLLASNMGIAAVDALLRGESNIVMCEKNDTICSMDIGKALKLDQMYKGRLKPGDLDGLTVKEITDLEVECRIKREKLSGLYNMANEISQ